MKRILGFAFVTLVLIMLTACGGNKKTPDALIVGDWVSTAPSTITESGLTVTFSDMTASYAKDQTANGSGKMSMSGAALPMTLKMGMETTSTWVIEGDKLKETITDIDLKMLTKIPGMPDLSGVFSEQMKARGEGVVTIIKLDKNTFEFKEEETGMQVVMKRK